MGSCITSHDYKDLTDLEDHHGPVACHEDCTISAQWPGTNNKIRISYGHWDLRISGDIAYYYVEKTFSLPAEFDCSNDEFDCDPYRGLVKSCRYQWVDWAGNALSARSVAAEEAVDYGDGPFADSESVDTVTENQGDGEDVNYGEGILFVDGELFVPPTSEPALTAVPLSGGVLLEPLTITDIASIVVVIVSLINLCCFVRMFARKCFRKGGAVAKYRKVHSMASEVEDKEEEEEQQML